MRTAITNLATIVSGNWTDPFCAGDTILMEEGLIRYVGAAGNVDLADADVVIDAGGTVAIPGLIDSHVHITFGDYTPRQKTVGFLESYVHGGVTTSISASEVHVPGRPTDPEGVKALAVAALKSFERYRPGGMKVHAGALILEPGLTKADLEEVRSKGVWLVKAGFGAFETPYDYADLIRWAKELGMIALVHTGGASIPGSSGIWADHLLHLQPQVSFHVNGGPVAMPDKDFPRLVSESQIALQVCTAGNLRTTLLVAELLTRANAFERLLVGTDTPTGSGIMPLGMIYTMSHLSSLINLPPEKAIAAATGNNAAVYGLNSGRLAVGADADVVIVDAPLGGTQSTALAALAHGDPFAVGAVVTDSVPRFVGRSRNTPATTRSIRVAECRLPMDFSTPRH